MLIIENVKDAHFFFFFISKLNIMSFFFFLIWIKFSYKIEYNLVTKLVIILNYNLTQYFFIGDES